MELIISILSLSLAFFALGWNFYRDVIQKPKLRVTFGVYSIATIKDINIIKEVIGFNVVNFGPGDIMINNIVLKYKKIKVEYSIVIPDLEWTKMPQKVLVGEKIQIVTKYFDKCFLNTKFLKAGVIDAFGRMHWASKKDNKYAKEVFDSDHTKKNLTTAST